ncbi:hypothetical protein TGARI_315798 [Toxoplasma gondii ARI]|uniref:Uncharacterized protein n=1 Tax=Toxoplasma gondii ARI TaxID=1074872 RepID=A0A139XN79_TOXGO|nr:hypothetical protein TGARI_315798 [Toxoplasma gondii ARI]
MVRFVPPCVVAVRITVALSGERAEREATMKAMEDELKTQQRQTAEQHGALVALLADFQRQQKESEDRNRKERERLDADHAALRQLQLTLKGAEEQQRRAFEELRTAVDDEKRDLMRKTQAKEFELKEREHRLEIAQRRLESQQRAVDAATRGVEETRARAAARLREVEGEVFTERKLALRDLEAAEQERRQLQQTKQEISLLQEDLDRRRQVVEEEGQKNLTRLVQVQRKEAEIKRLHAEAVEARAQAELRAMQAEQESSKCEERLQHVQALSKFVQKEQLDLLRLENRFLDPQTSLVSLSSSSLPSRASGVSRALRASQPLDLTHDCRQTNMFFRGRSYSFSSSFPPSLLLPSAQSSRLSASLPLNSGAASRPWREEREAAREGAFWSLPQGVRKRVSGVSAHPVTSSAYRRSPSAASSSESTILPPFLLQAFLRTPSRLSIRTSAVSTAQPPTSRGSSFLEGATDSCPSGLLSCVSSVSPFFESRANSAGHFALQRVSHKGSGESDLHNSSATRFWTRRRSHCQGEERKANASSGSSLALRRPSSSFASRGGGADHREERRGYEQALLARIDLATAGEFRPPRRRHSFREREQGVREREEDLTRGERGEGVKVEIRERRTDAGTAQSNLRPGFLRFPEVREACRCRRDAGGTTTGPE